jgi:hypothetical protein
MGFFIFFTRRLQVLLGFFFAIAPVFCGSLQAILP